MNLPPLPRYQFCKENRQILAQFLKTAKGQKNNKLCNHNEYRILNKFLPLQSELKEFQETIENDNVIIDISDSDEDVNGMECVSVDKTSTTPMLRNTDNLNLTIIEDISYAVKENLETQKYLVPATINNLQCSNNLEDIFVLLAEELNFEDVVNFGKSFENTICVNESVIMFYVKYLLLNKINVEFSEDVKDILNNLAQKHMDVVTEELSKYLLFTAESISKVFLQLLEKLNKNLQKNLLRYIAFNCESLQENYIGLIDILLNNQIDFDVLSKLVELLSSSADKYKTNKNFGKLVINLLKFTGKNIPLLEQPLEYIVRSHKSIWKTKILKLFQDSLEDISLMSQSFR